MICECCLADLSNKPNYATLLVNKDGVVFTWIYCDVHCLANDWQPECVDCTRDHGFDIVFTMACFLNGHQRLWIDDKE